MHTVKFCCRWDSKRECVMKERRAHNVCDRWWWFVCIKSHTEYSWDCVRYENVPYCADKCSKEKCDRYETIYDTCHRSDCHWVSQTCTRTEQRCDICTRCASWSSSHTCPDDDFYCSYGEKEARVYSCDDSCSYKMTGRINTRNPSCGDSNYPHIVIRKDAFAAYSKEEEQALMDFLGISPVGSKDIDEYLRGLNNQQLDRWENYWVGKWNSLNPPNKKALIQYTHSKKNQYYHTYSQVTVRRGPYSFIAYSKEEEEALKNFLGIDPPGVDIDTYLNGLSTSALKTWGDYWISRWMSLDPPNKNKLITFTRNKEDEYKKQGSCIDKARYSCYNHYVWWFDSCNMRTSIKERCANGCSGDSCLPASSCPSGWQSFGSSCYKLVHGTWDEAEAQCESMGAHLIVIDSASENEWAYNFGGNAWIGYNDKAQEGKWQWIGGTSSYTHWHSGEPNNAGDEDCAVYWGSDYWNDWGCGNHTNGICELDGNKPAKQQSNNCPSGWLSFGESCYKLVHGTWDEVKSKCESMDSHLITINNAQENDWALSNSHDNNAWIGFNDKEQEGKWQWVAGTSSYTHWHSGEPNNAGGKEDCAQFWVGSEWNDNQCSQSHNALCEKSISCDDGDKCTQDYYDNGCKHKKIINCHGDGICDSGENYCNSPQDCKAPQCGTCQKVSCTSGSPECVYKQNCCGNNVCEKGESCSTCPGDCNCALGIDLFSVTCNVRGNPCYNTNVYDNDTITTSFSLTNTSGHLIKVDFKTAGGNSLGSVTTSSAQVTKSFPLPSGRQSVLVDAIDLADSDSANALLFSLTIYPSSSHTTFSASSPFSYKEGDKAPTSSSVPLAPVTGYTPASAAFSASWAAALAAAGALAFARKGLYQTGKINKKILRGWKYKIYAFGEDIYDKAKFVVNDYNQWKKDAGIFGSSLNPLRFGFYGATRAGQFVTNVGNFIANDYNLWKNTQSGIWKGPLGVLKYSGERVWGAITGGVKSYVNAFKKDPVDTLAKTAIMAGGLLLAIPSGGSSLAIAGAALGVGGAVTMFAQESYEFAAAKDEQEVYDGAVSDTDDITWIGSGLMTAAVGAKMINEARSATLNDNIVKHIARKHGKDFKGTFTEGLANDKLLIKSGKSFSEGEYANEIGMSSKVTRPRYLLPMKIGRWPPKNIDRTLRRSTYTIVNNLNSNSKYIKRTTALFDDMPSDSFAITRGNQITYYRSNYPFLTRNSAYEVPIHEVMHVASFTPEVTFMGVSLSEREVFNMFLNIISKNKILYNELINDHDKLSYVYNEFLDIVAHKLSLTLKERGIIIDKDVYHSGVMDRFRKVNWLLNKLSKQNSLTARDVEELSDVKNQVVIAEVKVLSEGFEEEKTAKKVDHVYKLFNNDKYKIINETLGTLTELEKLGWEETEWAKKPRK